MAEKTKLGWFVLSPGQEFNHNCTMLTQTSQTDYEELCRLDVLGLANSSEHDQLGVYSEFTEQLVRAEEGWYCQDHVNIGQASLAHMAGGS